METENGCIFQLQITSYKLQIAADISIERWQSGFAAPTMAA
jgi:hypothetical protein